jgi:ABC-type spermidine/putrescine transport system permease subunit I
MENIDWPFAIGLAIVFVVMSVVRWRYFQSLARRRDRARAAKAAAQQRDGGPPA